MWFKRKVTPASFEGGCQYLESRQELSLARQELSLADKRYLNNSFRRTVNSKRKMVWNFEKKRMEKRVRGWPLFGYACPRCNIFESDMDHYLMDGVSVCGYCAKEIALLTNRWSVPYRPRPYRP